MIQFKGGESTKPTRCGRHGDESDVIIDPVCRVRQEIGWEGEHASSLVGADAAAEAEKIHATAK